MGHGAAAGSETATAISVEDELQESGTIYRNVSVDCGSWVWFSGTLTVKNHYVYILIHVNILFLFCAVWNGGLSSADPVHAERGTPLLCHKRTLRAGAESHKRAAAQTKAQSSCLSAVPHVIPRVSWAGGRPGERTGCLGKAACAARTPDGSLPLRKWGKCTWEGETCQDSWLKRDQLPVPSAPVPGTTQESPPAPSQGAPPLPGPHCHCQEQKRQRLFWKINLMLITPCLLPREWYEHWLPSSLLCSGLPLGSVSLFFSFSTGSDCEVPDAGSVEGNSHQRGDRWGNPQHPAMLGYLSQLQPSLEFVCWLIKCLEILLDERHCVSVGANLS